MAEKKEENINNIGKHQNKKISNIYKNKWIYFILALIKPLFGLENNSNNQYDILIKWILLIFKEKNQNNKEEKILENLNHFCLSLLNQFIKIVNISNEDLIYTNYSKNWEIKNGGIFFFEKNLQNKTQNIVQLFNLNDLISSSILDDDNINITHCLDENPEKIIVEILKKIYGRKNNKRKKKKFRLNSSKDNIK